MNSMERAIHRYMDKTHPCLAGQAVSWKVQFAPVPDDDSYTITLRVRPRRHVNVDVDTLMVRHTVSGEALRANNRGIADEMPVVVYSALFNLFKLAEREALKSATWDPDLRYKTYNPNLVALDHILRADYRPHPKAEMERTHELHLRLQEQYINDHTPTKETTMNLNETVTTDEFYIVHLAVPRAEADKLLAAVAADVDGDLVPLTWLEDLVLAELPQPVQLYVGMTYQYDESSYVYTITQLGKERVVLRRLTGNSAGGRGTRLIERREKIEHDLRSGRAVLVTDEDAEDEG